MPKTSNRKLFLCAMITTLTWGSSALAQSISTGMRISTISDYTFTSGGSTANNTDANVEGDGFWAPMTAAGTGWTGTARYKDNLVWDRDFYDPELTGNTVDNDVYFDGPLTAISMFIGHGLCDDIKQPIVACTSDAQCGAGAYCPGGTSPSPNVRICIRQGSHKLTTSSTTFSHGNVVTYGQAYGQSAARSLALGEGPTGGAFGGAGTNGGANVSVIVNSCGIRSRYMSTDTTYMFAGLHSIMMTMPTNAIGLSGTFSAFGFSDTAQWGARGSSFASFILANQGASVGDAWMNPTMVNNGFLGVNGAANNGANVLVTKDSTLARVQFHANTETWSQSRLEAYDATGLGYWWNRYLCNYSCNTLGM